MTRYSLNAAGLRRISSCVLGGAIAVMAGGGCSSDKTMISFDRFMEIQRQAGEAPTVTDAQQGAATQAGDALGPFRVGPGDTLVVTLTGLNAEIPTPVRVLAHGDGTITLPMAGAVKVGGLTLEDAEKAVSKAFVPTYVRDLSVHIDLGEYETTDVLVTGAVQTPGLVRLRRDQRTLLHAVIAGGGVTDATSGKATLERLRRPSEKIAVDLSKRTDLQTALTLPLLEDGDVVRVEAAFPNMVFIGGLVNAPAPQSYPPGARIRFLQALAASGGVRADLEPDEGRLIRQMPDGSDIHVKLDLDRLQKGRDENFILAAGDIIWVPETFETRVREFVNRNIFFRAGVSVSYDPIQFEFTRRALRQDSPGGFSSAINDGLRFGLQGAFFPPVQPVP